MVNSPNDDNDGDSILAVEDLTYYYEEDRPVFDGIDFSIDPGDSVAISGRSGVGKTTLLEIIGTMRTPRSGRVKLMGESVYDCSVTERARLRGDYLGFVFQEGHLLPDLTVWENCRLAVTLTPRDWGADRIRERYESLMEGLGLDPKRGDERPARFSTGERQRLTVVRALIHDPDLLVADEPTGNLDPETSEQLLTTLFPLLNDHDLGVLVATHDRDLAQSLESIYNLEGAHLEHVG